MLQHPSQRKLYFEHFTMHCRCFMTTVALGGEVITVHSLYVLETSRPRQGRFIDLVLLRQRPPTAKTTLMLATMIVFDSNWYYYFSIVIWIRLRHKLSHGTVCRIQG